MFAVIERRSRWRPKERKSPSTISLESFQQALPEAPLDADQNSRQSSASSSSLETVTCTSCTSGCSSSGNSSRRSSEYRRRHHRSKRTTVAYQLGSAAVRAPPSYCKRCKECQRHIRNPAGWSSSNSSSSSSLTVSISPAYRRTPRYRGRKARTHRRTRTAQSTTEEIDLLEAEITRKLSISSSGIEMDPDASDEEHMCKRIVCYILHAILLHSRKKNTHRAL